MPTAYLGLGSNMGDREAYLRAALKIINTNTSINITKVSGIYETEAVGYAPQRRFLNVVVEIETTLSAIKLLKISQFVEEFLRRKKKVRWASRIIDVDILLYGQEEIRLPELVIPHPEMTKRSFILVPLLEIAPHIALPNGKPANDYLGSLSLSGVERVGNLEI